MFLSIGTAMALIPLGVWAYKDLTMKYEWSEEEKLPSKSLRGWHVPIGVDSQRRKYSLDFNKTPHLVLGGATRYGKSNLLNSIVVSLMRLRPEDVTFTMIDLKGGIELGDYEVMENCRGVAYEPQDALRLLSSVYLEMRDTQEYLKRKRMRKQWWKKHFIIIDEVGELNPSEETCRETKKLKQECQSLMSKISRLGAGLGFHLILATQYPTGDVLPRQCKQNSDAKICFRVQSGTASKVVLDEVGAEELPDIRGRAIFQRGADRYTVQVYLVGETDIENTIEKHRRKPHEHIELETIEHETREDFTLFEETQFSDEDTTF